MRASVPQPSTSGRPCEAAAPVYSGPRYECQRRGTPVPRQHQRQRRALVAAAADKPDWLRDLEETAHIDEDAARLLAGANGNPDVVQRRMRDEQDAMHARIMGTKYGGEDAPVDVSFRSPVEQFSLWVWLEMYRPPTSADLELLQEVLNSWFLVGRLGGYNSTNLQVLYHQDEELEDLAYDTDDAGGMASTFHDMAPLESRGAWARFWVDLGTADELALDILLNALSTFSREQLGIRQVVVGGQNDDWPTPKREEFLPEVTMDPLRGPLRRGGGYDDEDADEDDGYFP